MITVLADKYLYKLSAFLPENVRLLQYDPGEGLPDSLSGIDALLIRTVTPVNKKTLHTIPESLQFIATGSAGTDHVDADYLKRNNVTFASAEGCNARSVAEYVATTLLLWANERNKDLTKHRVGIIGVGHVGGAVLQLLEQLSIPVTTYDPPREKRDSDFISASEADVLDSDILTFHTPLTACGTHPTRYWLDTEKLQRYSFNLIINTSRGGVVHEDALLQAHGAGKVGDMITDVWENEPVFKDELAHKSFIKTPHIAGYSIQAKLKASQIICNKLARHFNLVPKCHSPTLSRKIDVHLPHPVASISEVLGVIHPVLAYQKKLMELTGKPPASKGSQFNKLRAEFPLRNEFSILDLPLSVIKRFSILSTLLS